MIHKLTDVHVLKYPMLRVTFDDGMSGDIDLSDDINTKPIFAELRDETFFRKVALHIDGFSLGWKLDQLYKELDLSADGLRADVETILVKQAAAEYRAKLQAAE